MGDPGPHYNDLDGSRNDLDTFSGGYAVNITTHVVEKMFDGYNPFQFKVHPNPFNEQIQVDLVLPEMKWIDLAIYANMITRYIP